jgi:hypothetical protein
VPFVSQHAKAVTVYHGFVKNLSTETIRNTLDIKQGPVIALVSLRDPNFKTKFLWTPPASARTPKDVLNAVTADALDGFVTDWSAGRLRPYLKSAPRPVSDRDDKDPSSTLRTVVGASFHELIVEEKRAVLLLSAAPWHIGCRQLEQNLDMANRVLRWCYEQKQKGSAAAGSAAAPAPAAAAPSVAEAGLAPDSKSVRDLNVPFLPAFWR